jgi:hypothetical protein
MNKKAVLKMDNLPGLINYQKRAAIIHKYNYSIIGEIHKLATAECEAQRAYDYKLVYLWLMGDCPHRVMADLDGGPDISLRKRCECFQCLEELKESGVTQ